MRLFIAIEIPEQWRRAAAASAAMLVRRAGVDLRVSQAGNTHLTLKFLGEIEDADVPLLVASLDRVRAARCELRLTRPGTFGPAARTRVVWLGVAGDTRCLQRLSAEVDEAVAVAGLQIERQFWRPHLTLARVRGRASSYERRVLADLVRKLPESDSESFVADTISLYRSHLGEGSPRYELLTSVRIG
jgi:RNA 2',3'-cyclic 3'-phosphodiesterase